MLTTEKCVDTKAAPPAGRIRDEHTLTTSAIIGGILWIVLCAWEQPSVFSARWV